MIRLFQDRRSGMDALQALTAGPLSGHNGLTVNPLRQNQRDWSTEKRQT
jgi:hypothetical protein